MTTMNKINAIKFLKFRIIILKENVLHSTMNRNGLRIRSLSVHDPNPNQPTNQPPITRTQTIPEDLN
ncbi:hypothetical protein L1987_17010 [Smallanthus sonchifolius]|uniref:Uncharacterized protein n=1 Tax=Smallanthus sonchifolius TaxID=185202 RepID=A0ACB9IVP4_9ASTR|nr:hypothetical protein L1987_17010 [Smallanthus sonchifolius]